MSDDRSKIMKIGQNPAWSIDAGDELEKALGKHVSEYKKGLVCESQGYGIGAFAYYRRIVEVVIDDLLRDVIYFVEQDQQGEYKQSLEKVRNDIRADVRIAAVKDLMPAVLRPGGANPLKELHAALSEGIHVQADGECLEYASVIRESLVFLVDQVSRTKQSAKAYEESLKALQSKRQRRDEDVKAIEKQESPSRPKDNS